VLVDIELALVLLSFNLSPPEDEGGSEPLSPMLLRDSVLETGFFP
jgi:hypothetical protein